MKQLKSGLQAPVGGKWKRAGHVIISKKAIQKFEFGIAFLLFLLSGTSLFGEEVTMTFVAPAKPLLAGSQSGLWLYCLNNSSNEVRRIFEPSLQGKFLLPSGNLDAVLDLKRHDVDEVRIAPGAFVKEEYSVEIPTNLQGQVTLDISNYNQVAMRVETPGAEVNIGTNNNPPFMAQTNLSTRSVLARFFGNHLFPYEPIYFLIGTYPAAEFQLSLKYQIFDFTNNYHTLTNLYFAYTQTSYWDLISSDPSFFDSSYKPSVFIYHPSILSTESKSVVLDLQGGAEHESNGQGGARERSIYTAYFQPTLTFGRPGHLQLTLQPRAWTYFLVGHNNPDIAHYRGYADLLTLLTLKNDPNSWVNFQLGTKFRIGDEGSHPGVQIDFRYKIPHFNPTLQMQYFTGYGQTFRQYNVYSHGFRVGLCLWYWPDYPASRAN
ncbi:MAG TPA: phospholipase A [Verrucomicrobiae bacterium]|nr:phospholipase A [Verrucomicrobiae bacterium]